ncbi:MAG: internal scaffolding protein [Microvirus sp.]|nr:MAG: internal scaffolding protein [Microvirus sp.]
MSFYVPHDRVGLDTGSDSFVQQSFKDECDINNILAQYKQTGIISHISANAAQGRYMDLPSDVDLQMSFSIVAQATEAFASLPATVRDRFENDPSHFLAAFTDPAMADELRALGLLNPAPAPVIPPAAE